MIDSFRLRDNYHYRNPNVQMTFLLTCKIKLVVAKTEKKIENVLLMF